MDQHGEEEEHSSEDSRGHRRKDDVVDAAAEVAMNNHGDESMDHQRDGGYEEAEEETAGVLKEVEAVEVAVEVVGGRGSEAAASSEPLLAHPCSLFQLLLRACAGCLSLHGYCSDDDPKPAAAANGTAATESPQEGDQGGGDKAASYLRVQEVVTQVWAVRRRPAPPSRPREGSGGNGGIHH